MTEDSSETPAQEKPKYPVLSLSEFLESSAPLHPVQVSDLFRVDGRSLELTRPVLTLYCEHEKCMGPRFFAYRDQTGGLYNRDPGERNEVFVEFLCRNSRSTLKSFSLLTFELFQDGSGVVVKIGEWPPFGPKTPSRLLRLLGEDKELFLRGRRAECHGLGIGAFTYYRRVVENQKNRLLDEIIKVVQKVEPSPASIVEDLTKAKGTFQFTQAISDVKLAIPQVLLIDGHNPLLLLHAALSSGIHDKTDDECLELAKNIRVVLGGLAERLGQALSQRQELKDAVSKLLQVNSGKGKQKISQQKKTPDQK
ncbi:MAG: hypothetical protein WBD64_08405 [Candidatus Zixiibacteriota bacterium]